MTKLDTLSLASIHSEVLRNLTGITKKFTSPYDPKYEKYYERLLPLFTGKYQCPICSGKYEDEKISYHTIDPEVYFGLLVLHHEKYVATAALVSSEGAIQHFLSTYHERLSKYKDIKHYVVSKYKVSQEGLVLNALLVGERVVNILQESRKISRWDAVCIAVDFNMVSDLYIFACKEYNLSSYHANKLIFLRSRLNNFANNMEDRNVLALKNTIRRISIEFYENNLTEIVVKKKKRHPKYTGYNSKEAWSREA